MTPSPIPSAPLVADVSRIAAMNNRIIRNLEITECYADLSAAMRSRTGDAANWCTFATWASRQAGSTIRGEDLLERLERQLGQTASLLAPLQSFYRFLLRKGLLEPETMLGRAVSEIHTPFDAFERASDAVARGNLKVFAEIGQEFARFIASVPVDAPPDGEAMQAFVAKLRQGPPPDGQDYLREAFGYYQQQRQEIDPAARAAWLLLANLKIGLHEQSRLQPQIAEAIVAPLETVEDLGQRLLPKLFPNTQQWPPALRQLSAWAVNLLAAKLRAAAVSLTRGVVTESLMVLALPNGVLALGKNLDAPVPPVFENISNEELVRLIGEYDTCTPENSDCSATDWSDMRQRMHYILHLFRAFAEEMSLYARPFTPEQVAKFRRGEVPDGDL